MTISRKYLPSKYDVLVQALRGHYGISEWEGTASKPEMKRNKHDNFRHVTC